MDTAAMLLLYRHENSLKQEDAADILGCTRANLSKWEKYGIPSLQRRRVMAKIMPSIEAANVRTVRTMVREGPRHCYFIDPEGKTLAVSRDAARYIGVSQEEAVGMSVFDYPNAKNVEEMYHACVFSGLFRGKVLQILLDGIRPNEDISRVTTVAGCITPIGVETEGKSGALLTFYPSSSRQNSMSIDVQEWPPND